MVTNSDKAVMVRTYWIGLVLILFMGDVIAQDYDNPGLGREPVATYPQDYKPLGIRAGAFMLHPGVQLAAEFTDNVFFTRGNTVSDVVYHIRPYVTAQSTWSRHSLNVTLSADLAWFQDYGRQDYQDYFFTVSGRVDVKNRSFFSYGLSYMNLHEDRSNRDAQQGFEPTRYDMYGANVGYDHTFNRLSMGVNYSHMWLDYEDNVSLTGEVVEHTARNRNDGTWSFTAGYQFKTDMQAFLTYSPYSVDYEDEFDASGYDRSGDGYSVYGGINFTLTGKLDGDLSVGYNERGYDDPRLPDVSGWGLGAGLQWNPTYLTSVHGRIDTSIEETTSAFSSGYLRTLYSLRADHELLRYLQISGFVSYSDNDYEQIAGAPEFAREYDRIWRYGVGLNWYINRYMYLNASYERANMTTNVPLDGYEVNRVWLMLGLER